MGKITEAVFPENMFCVEVYNSLSYLRTDDVERNGMFLDEVHKCLLGRYNRLFRRVRETRWN